MIALETPVGLEEFLDAYMEAALFNSSDESTPSGGYPLDRNYGVEDITPETIERMRDDCIKFLDNPLGGRLIAIAEELAEKGHWSLPYGSEDSAMEFAGRYFWLTRNGAGMGFWDGEWPKGIADGMNELADSFGEFHLFVEDGVIEGY